MHIQFSGGLQLLVSLYLHFFPFLFAPPPPPSSLPPIYPLSQIRSLNNLLLCHQIYFSCDVVDIVVLKISLKEIDSSKIIIVLCQGYKVTLGYTRFFNCTLDLFVALRLVMRIPFGLFHLLVIFRMHRKTNQIPTKIITA